MHLSLGLHVSQDPDQALADAADLRVVADAVERLAVARAVAQGWGWARIAAALQATPGDVRHRHAGHPRHTRKRHRREVPPAAPQKATAHRSR